MALGSPLNSGWLARYLVASEAMTPTASPPRKVNGRLENRPMATAPKAWTTSSVRRAASRPRTGAMRMPDAAAKVAPMTHAAVRTRVGSVPTMSSSVGLSTTARIVTPSRLRRRNSHSPPAATIEKSTLISWASVIWTPATAKEFWGRNSGKLLVCGAKADVEEALDGQQEADGADDPGDRSGSGQAAHDPLEDDAHDRAEEADAEQGRERPGEAVLHMQGVECVGGGRGHGTVGEVEDARGPVGQHQAEAGQAVERTAGETDDDERQDLSHYPKHLI